MRRARGFSLVELLVVVSIISLLVAILMPTLGRAQELARRGSCTSSLSAIGRGVSMYATDNNGYIPARNESIGFMNLVGRNGQTAEPPAVPTGCQSRGWYQMVVQKMIRREHFQCPSDRDVDRDIYDGQWYDFPAPTTATGAYPLSYAMQVTMVSPGNANPALRGVSIHISDRSDLAILADQSPFVNWQYRGPGAGSYWNNTWNTITPAEDSANNSPNHGHEGQNVLYLGSQVQWQGSCLAGPSRDNIWTVKGAGQFGIAADSRQARPADKEDSFLYP